MTENDESRHLLGKHHKQAPMMNEDQPANGKYEDIIAGGLSISKTAIFIVAQMAGSGILALPNAIAGTGWTGVALLIVMGLLALYCCVMLGKCLVLIRQKHDIPAKIRDPYPLIGFYAAGKTGKYVVEICILLTLIGSSVVYLILSAKQISSILDVSLGSFASTERTEFRMWILICGAVLIPCTLFASPKEMWFIAYGASLCSLAACVLIIIRASMVIYQHGTAPESALKDPTVKSFFNAFGTIAFAYGGGVLIPTLQSDMKRPSQFIYAAVLGFSGILILYIPSSVLPYLGLGSDIESSILVTLLTLPGTSGRTLVKVAETLMTFHLLFAIVILSNPTTQLLEEKFGIPHEFGWRRIILRSSTGLLAIGIAELFPNFGPILSFIGASTVTMMSFILPAVFYLRLQSSHLIPLHQKVFHCEIVLIALVCGCCGIYSAVQGFSNPFTA